MKTNNIFRLLTLAMAAVAFAFVTSCEGPAGPAGDPGTNGTDGVAGADGANGQDINETCKQCHNEGTEVLNTAFQQFGESGHALELIMTEVVSVLVATILKALFQESV